MNKTLLAAAVALTTAAFSATTASAALPIYPTPGVENPVNYTFTAAATGDITAYFTGSTASFTQELGMLINGTPTGIIGLNNKTSNYGDSLVLGSANAGDTLTFFINVITTGDVFYSQKSLNFDGVNHVFSAGYAGDALVPAGTYVAFEDLRGGGDLNYFDETFVFTNVSAAVPEPASWALMIVGFGMVGVTLRRRKAVIA